MASTDSSEATRCGSISAFLYRKTELCALTVTCGSCERLFIRESVIPSERYSSSLLPLSFLKGSTAIDLAARDWLRNDRYASAPTAPQIATNKMARTMLRLEYSR